MNQKQIEFLWNAARSVPVNSPCAGVIVSQLLSKFKDKCEASTSTKIPETIFKESSVCKYCKNPWKNLHYKVAMKARKRMTKSLKKIQLRQNRNESRLRPYDKKFTRFLNSSNTLILTCPVCKKNSKFPMPPRNIDKKVTEKVPDTQMKKKKKKRIKDPLCGLKMSLVEAKPGKKCTIDLQKESVVQTEISTSPQAPQICVVTPVKQVSTSKCTPHQKLNNTFTNKNISQKFNNTPTNKNVSSVDKKKKEKFFDKNVLRELLKQSEQRVSLKDLLYTNP